MLTQNTEQKQTTCKIEKRLPQSNIYKKDNTYYFEVYLPGATKDNIDIKYEQNILNIKTNVSNEDDFLYTFENIQYQRYFQIDDKINDKEIKADFKDGVLYIQIPILQYKVKKITIT